MGEEGAFKRNEGNALKAQSYSKPFMRCLGTIWCIWLGQSLSWLSLEDIPIPLGSGLRAAAGGSVTGCV